MLRRKPTAIILTAEDISIYEDNRAQEVAAREKAAIQAQKQAQSTPNHEKNLSQNVNLRNPNDELRPLPGDRARVAQVKTREERLGLASGSSRG